MSDGLPPGHVDVHAHVVLEETLGAAGARGPSIGATEDGRPVYRIGEYRLEGVDYRGSAFMDVDVRLARMDEHGIAHQALSPNPLTWFHHVDGGTATDWCRAHNDAIAAHIAPHRDRLSGFAQLPMQEPEAAADELARAVRELGLSGGAMGTDIGRPLDDETLTTVWDAAVDLDVPLYLHPGPPGIDGPRSDARTARHDFDLHGGFAHEETLAVVTLVMGGVLDRHPALDLCLSHGGGATALLYPRLRHAMATRPGGTGDPGDVDRALRRLWFDTHVGDAASLQLLVDRVGTDRLVLGTNFAGWDDTGPHTHGVDPAVLRANAARLLRLP